MATEVVGGSCLCGSIRYELQGSLGPVYCCHCKNCQKATGSAFAPLVAIESSRFRWASGEELVTRHTSTGETGGVTRWSCSRCGSALGLVSSVPEFQDSCGILVGTLDDTADLKLWGHEWVSSQPPWFKLHDGLPAFEGYPPAAYFSAAAKGPLSPDLELALAKMPRAVMRCGSCETAYPAGLEKCSKCGAGLPTIE
jgi:hypothetical protein